MPRLSRKAIIDRLAAVEAQYREVTRLHDSPLLNERFSALRLVNRALRGDSEALKELEGGASGWVRTARAAAQ